MLATVEDTLIKMEERSEGNSKKLGTVIDR
jgi:hypothetical protein